MRTLFILIVLVCCLLPLAAEQQLLSITTDVFALEGLVKDTISIRSVCSFVLTDDFGLSFPVTCTYEKEIGGTSLLQAGLLLTYRPFRNSWFLGVSLSQIGILIRDAYQEEEKRLQFLNEMIFGWTYRLPNGLTIEPQIIIADPNGVFNSSYQELQTRFSYFPMTRISLLLGWSFGIGDEVS